MRDLSVMVKFVLSDVIPANEDTLRHKLGVLYTDICYRPPECQPEDWYSFGQILATYCGDPAGVEWKERLKRLVCDEEKIPEDRVAAIRKEQGYKPEEHDESGV